MLPPNPSLSPKPVLQHIRQSLQKESLTFSFLNPSLKLAENPTQPILELEALLNQKAKINGKWLKKGERIKEYTLKEIQNNQVILKSKDALFQLRLKNKEVFK